MINNVNHRDTPTIPTIEIQAGTVKGKLLSLKINKATGPDGITPRLIKMAGDSIAAPLAALFTLS